MKLDARVDPKSLTTNVCIYDLQEQIIRKDVIAFDTEEGWLEVWKVHPMKEGMKPGLYSFNLYQKDKKNKPLTIKIYHDYEVFDKETKTILDKSINKYPKENKNG